MVVDLKKVGYGSYAMSKQYDFLGASIYITPGATANCQMAVLGCTATIFKYENALEILKDIGSKACRKILLIDIKQSEIPKLKEIVSEECIMSETWYNSTNNSKMAIILLEVSALKAPDKSKVKSDKKLEEAF